MKRRYVPGLLFGFGVVCIALAIGLRLGHDEGFRAGAASVFCLESGPTPPRPIPREPNYGDSGLSLSPYNAPAYRPQAY